jgi:hypothetical protein
MWQWVVVDDERESSWCFILFGLNTVECMSKEEQFALGFVHLSLEQNDVADRWHFPAPTHRQGQWSARDYAAPFKLGHVDERERALLGSDRAHDALETNLTTVAVHPSHELLDA